MGRRGFGEERGRRYARRGGRDDPDDSDDDRRGRHAGRGGGRGGGRSGRLFDHGELRLVVLALISERRRHGYEIIKEIENRVAGTYSPSPGVIYPTLTMLEELGHAALTESDGKKLYTITDEGAAYLSVHRTALNVALSQMEAVRVANNGVPPPQIVRATENLKLALRLRQGRGPLTEEQIRKIAETLDAAALAIERS
jgi:DNA-binding PadR family transcriptional regulator